MRKGSKEAKAWGRKMKRARNAKNGRKKTKRKTTTRKRSTRKGQRRKTARRAYTGLKKRRTRRKKSEKAWNF